MDTKVAFFLPSLAGGGAERVIINLCEYISRRGIQNDLIVASASGQDRAKLPSNIRLIELGPARPIRVVPKLIQYIRKVKPKALLTTITNANVAALIATSFSGMPMKCIVREASTLGVEIQKSSRLNQIILPIFVRLLYSRASSIVAPSNGVAQDLAEILKLPLHKIKVIPNPIVSPHMLAKAKVIPDHPWLKNGSQPIIIGMGRLTIQKDFTTLIKAFKILKKRQNAKLIIIGTGDQRTELQRLIEKEKLCEEVSMPGFVENPYSYLSRASAFVLSSKWEGLPGVLIEALACGTKVISTDCPSGPKEILDNGRYGQLVPIGDYKSMAIAIERALNSEFKAADPKEWIKMFQFDRNADSYIKLLLN